MGVALVDMYVWHWLYEHPTASAADLKAQVIAIAQQVWNQYYANNLGEENSPILAIYSHMIDSPLYLPNYPYGHIIQFQLEQQLKGKDIAAEIERIYPVGRLTPQNWMRHAVGTEVSTQPLLTAATEALKELK
jgi:oligoendopeptidase F